MKVDELMRVNEAFTAPYKFTTLPLGTFGKDYESTFKTDDGSFVIVGFEWWAGPEIYLVSFARNDETKLTGGGDAIRIFSTVIKVLKDFAAEHKPPFIGFSSTKDEQSRVKLYRRLAKKFEAEGGYALVDKLEDIKHDVAPHWVKNMVKMVKNSEVMVLARKELLK